MIHVRETYCSIRWILHNFVVKVSNVGDGVGGSGGC